MTSAPISAISIVQMGPDRIRVRSTTNKSSKGLMYLFLIRQERPRKPIKFLDRQQPNFARKGPQKAQHAQTEKIVWVRFFCLLWLFLFEFRPLSVRGSSIAQRCLSCLPPAQSQNGRGKPGTTQSRCPRAEESG